MLPMSKHRRKTADASGRHPGRSGRPTAEDGEDDVGLKAIHGTLDEELDGKAWNELPAAQRQARQLAPCYELVDQVIGDAERLGCFATESTRATPASGCLLRSASPDDGRVAASSTRAIRPIPRRGAATSSGPLGRCGPGGNRNCVARLPAPALHDYGGKPPSLGASSGGAFGCP